VTVSQGTVAFTPEYPSQFIITAPNVAGSLVLTVNNKTYPITILPLQVFAPTIKLPAAGTTVSCDTVMLVGSQYYSPLNAEADAASAATGMNALSDPVGSSAYNQGLIDPQVSSTWQIATDAAFTTIIDQGTLTAPLFTQFLSKGLSLNTTYYARVMYSATTTLPSVWSAPVSFATGNLCYPTAEVYETLSPNNNPGIYTYDWFGNAVACSADGNTLIVSDPRNYSGMSETQGSLRVYDTSTFPYTLKQTIANPNSTLTFTYAVDITPDGSYFVVTDPNTTAPSATTDIGTGSFFIYGLQAGQYVLLGTYTAPSYGAAITNRYFGTAAKFSQDGTRLFMSDGVNIGLGSTTTHNSVYCYSFVGGVPTLIATIADPGQSADFSQTFGSSLSVSHDGRTVATGSTLFSASKPGIAYVFHDTTGGLTPSFSAIVIAPSTTWAAATNASSFGSSVSLSSDLAYLAVGAPQIVNPANASEISGTVFLYSLNITALTYTDNGVTLSTNTTVLESFGFEVYFGQTPSYLYVLGAALYLYQVSATPTLIDTLFFTNPALNGSLSNYRPMIGSASVGGNTVAASQTDNRVYIGNTANSAIMNIFNGTGIVGEFACFTNPTFTAVPAVGSSGSSGLA
jgi:hypothetical protein